MTQTLNGRDVTLGADVHMRVRAPENPAETAGPAVEAAKSACTPVHTRAVPDQLADDHAHGESSVRNFVSQHGGEALHALDQSWLLTETPPTAGEAWKTVFPAKGEASGKTAWLAMSAAGLFRACAVSLLHLALLAVGTRMRAGVFGVLFVLAVAGSCAAHNL